MRRLCAILLCMFLMSCTLIMPAGNENNKSVNETFDVNETMEIEVNETVEENETIEEINETIKQEVNATDNETEENATEEYDVPANYEGFGFMEVIAEGDNTILDGDNSIIFDSSEGYFRLLVEFNSYTEGIEVDFDCEAGDRKIIPDDVAPTLIAYRNTSDADILVQFVRLGYNPNAKYGEGGKYSRTLKWANSTTIPVEVYSHVWMVADQPEDKKCTFYVRSSNPEYEISKKVEIAYYDAGDN